MYLHANIFTVSYINLGCSAITPMATISTNEFSLGCLAGVQCGKQPGSTVLPEEVI
jgi:hypothetical protein